MGMNVIYVRKSTDSRSCNCCDARNYKSSFPGFGRQVDVIYDVNIGGLVPALCEDCLRNLYSILGGIVNGEDNG